MSLDITIMEQKEHRCPDCGKLVFMETVIEAESGGKVWYDFLAEIGYYNQYGISNGHSDWYGKDMTLNEEQVQKLRDFVRKNVPYNTDMILFLTKKPMSSGRKIAINADW